MFYYTHKEVWQKLTAIPAHLSHRQNFQNGVRELGAFSGSSMVLFNIPGSTVKPDPVRPSSGTSMVTPGLISFLKLYQSPNPWQPSLWKPAWLRGQRTSDHVAGVASIREWGGEGLSPTHPSFKAWETTAPSKGSRAEESQLLSAHFQAIAGGASNQISQRKSHQKIYSICISWVALPLEIPFIWQRLQSRLNFEESFPS